MKIRISYPPNSTDLKEIVELKISNIRKKYNSITSFELKCVEDNHNEEKVVLINAHVPGHDLSINKNGSTWEKAVNSAFNTLTRQLNKIKEQR